MTHGFPRLSAAVERLRVHFMRLTEAQLVFDRTWSEEELARLDEKYGVALPPSYRFFMLHHGPLSIEHWGRRRFEMVAPDSLFGASPDPEDAAGADDPDALEAIEDAIAHALFFQYQATDAVQDFYVFSTRARRADGELHVMSYRHDEVFENPQSAPDRACSAIHTFEDHFCDFTSYVIEQLDLK